MLEYRILKLVLSFVQAEVAKIPQNYALRILDLLHIQITMPFYLSKFTVHPDCFGLQLLKI